LNMQRISMLIDRRVVFALVLGVSSGLPLALTGATLQAWLTHEGVSLQSIAWFSLVGVPYTWKFVWAPFLDRYTLPWSGRRRAWMMVFQWMLAVAVMVMAWTPVPEGLPLLAILAVLLAFSSASQDIVIDAWRTEILSPAQRGVGAAAAVMGYRVGMLISGALALVLADRWGWRPVFVALAAVFFVMPLMTLFAPERPSTENRPQNFFEALLGPIRAFFAREGALLLILLIVLYKLSDAFATSLSTTFLLRGVGFSLTEVGVVNKAGALAATLVGAFVGGWGLSWMGLRGSLLVFGVIQALSAFGFYALALAGHDWALMVSAVLLENFTSGMGTAAFAALLMSLCEVRYSATQFALLSALSAVGRVYVGPSSAYLAETLGWPNFFIFSVAAGIPGLLMVVWLWPRLQDERPIR
jgi:PAT family beta-lactamase induction signal transducer AmpG